MVQPQVSRQEPLRRSRQAYTPVTVAAYTAKAGDSVLGVNRAGVVTVTLPSGQALWGRIFTVKDESGAAATNNITVATEGAETIDGSATDVINVNYGARSYYSDGANWFILPADPTASTTYEAPALTLGTANAEGTGDSIRSGATIAIFDATAPSTQAHGDSAAAGSAAIAARRDHKHAMPAAGVGSDISARAYHSASQSIANNTTTALAFNSEDFDTDTIHDTATNNSRLTCKTAGKYYIHGQVAWAASTAGIRLMELYLNGTTLIARVTMGTSTGEDSPRQQISTLYDLAVNDYVELRVYQSSGAALNVELLTGVSPHFMMAKVLG
ncbi:MAG: hypothetical protein O2913_06435 [Chloroflexi bacterium]|nr:hypothetical protein [Chloroflexota bacterium]